MDITTDDGVRLNVLVEGDAAHPPLILSNSLGTTMEMWAPQVADLVGRFRLVRYDTRGHGGSDSPPGDYTIDRLGRDVLGIADALGLDTFDYCGLSMGGMTGLWLGINAGDRLRRLVVANAAAFAGGPGIWAGRMALVREGGMESMVEPVIPRWFTPGFRTTHGALVDRITQTMVALDPQGYLGCNAALRDMDLRPSLSTITTPTLLIAGDSDGGPPPAVVEAMGKAIAGATVVTLPAAHLSNFEAPDAFTAALLDFLS